MARIRTLKPDFFRSRSLARVPVAARLTFQGLWCEADDHGRGIADDRLLCGVLWALDDDITPPVVADHLTKLAETGHIRLYEVDGEAYYEIVGWEKHQAASYRRGDPMHPLPPAKTPSSGTLHDQACKEVPDAQSDVLEGNREGNREGKGTGNPHQADAGSSDASSDMSDAFGPDVIRLCDRLADAIEGNGSKRPKVGKTWLSACDLMLRVDERTPEQVERAIDWSQSHEFWRSNILSMGKLREKFDQLRLQAKRESNGQRAPNGRPSNLALLRESLEEEMAG